MEMIAFQTYSYHDIQTLIPLIRRGKVIEEVILDPPREIRDMSMKWFQQFLPGL
jgi:hypothetical protein